MRSKSHILSGKLDQWVKKIARKMEDGFLCTLNTRISTLNVSFLDLGSTFDCEEASLKMLSVLEKLFIAFR